MRLLALLLLAAPAHAATYDCADALGEVAVSFDYERGEAAPFPRVEMRIAGDFGLSTDPASEDHDGEFVAATHEAPGFMGADLRVRDEAGEASGPLAMVLRIVEVSEGQDTLITGGVAVGAGGVWALTCARH